MLPYRTPAAERLADLATRLQGGPRRTIAILGAGMAGLTAATELTRHGHVAQVFEATGRPGGRVHTWRPTCSHERHSDPDLGHEFGAMRIPATHDFTRHYVECTGLTESLRPFITSYEDDDAWLYLRGEKFKMKNSGAYVPGMYDLSESDSSKLFRVTPLTAEKYRSSLQGVLVPQVLEPIMKQVKDADAAALLLEGPPTPLSAELEATTWGELVSRTFPDFPDAGELVGLSTMTDVWWHVCATFFVREELLKSFRPFHEISEGTDRLPARLAAALGDAIKYHQAVTSIDITGEKAQVTTQVTRPDGIDDSYSSIDWSAEQETHTFDLVLCTIPFAVLRGMQLKGFSPTKLSAIREMHYESSTKVLLLCDRRRWEADEIVGGATISDTILRSTYYPSDHFVSDRGGQEQPDSAGESLYTISRPLAKDTAASTTRSEEPGVLVASYNWGMDARRMGAMTHSERVEACLGILEQLHPGIREDLGADEDFKAHTASRCWDNHPWARGAFAMPQPNETRRHFENGRKPEGGVFFAGEHLSFNPGWMQGAIISALVAVETMFQ